MPAIHRTQFTFYSSFWEAINGLPDELFVPIVKAICVYALDGEEIALDPIPRAIFAVIKPNLDSSRQRAERGKLGGSKSKTEANASKSEANGSKTQAEPKQTEANRKQEQNASKIKEEIENKREEEIKIEIKDDSHLSPPFPPSPGGEEKKPSKKDADFEIFWSAYPRKVGKLDAKRAFGKVKVPVETLVSAIEQQKCSDQWTRDNGQYIPHPATWLNRGDWEAELPTSRRECTAGAIDIDAMRSLMDKI